MANIEAFIIEFIRLHPYLCFSGILGAFVLVCVIGTILNAPEIKDHE